MLGHLLVHRRPSVFVAFGGEQTCGARVRHERQVVALGVDSLENAIAADGQPVHLSARHHQPQGQTTGISANVNRVPVAVGDGAEIPLPTESEVVHVVPGDEVEGVQVSPVAGELIQLLVCRGGNLINIHLIETGLVLTDRTDADVAQVGNVQSPIGRHSQRGGGLQLGVFGVPAVT